MNSSYKEPLDWLENQYQPMCQYLRQWVEINSGSLNLAGLNQISCQLVGAFEELGGESESIELEPLQKLSLDGQITQQHLGRALRIHKRSQSPFKILLCGHMDTVYPVDSSFQQIKSISNNTWNGPGVADMKGGLVVILFALMALERSSFGKNIGWEVFINADEELGSFGSAKLLQACAKRNDIGLVFEPSLNDNGLLAGQRKGSAKYTVVVQGKAAHAGRAFHEGQNAIVALSKLIGDINELNENSYGATINVGLIEGGVAANVVADRAMCTLDIRYVDSQHEQWLKQSLNDIFDIYNQSENIKVKVQGAFGRAPKMLTGQTLKLYQLVAQTGQQLNQNIQWQDCGGCCDGNNLAAAGLPNIDTLGVRGGKIHSVDEYIILDSLVERAQLTALLLMQFASGEIGLS